ncbi:unnamed protein product (macronuclear) [Paramecium tetraurelia]|uniref:Uncharacterized protein n=1 Tax=Paramecium tetraurelia TaxID=5888 RepID=A0BJE8_PARTE|nr:uncharacterized protein GSPATT00029292001 [Paramecium tetraurelia]CAK58665.1 unnamed protein product [Paramecium tetraurelia]|eukprot:XP_001426063.1 hypothetical protein (macronuclear) [Paramecium tetraurelia strain d4-2]
MKLLRNDDKQLQVTQIIVSTFIFWVDLQGQFKANYSFIKFIQILQCKAFEIYRQSKIPFK